jgi:hypothetical protein
MLLLLLPQTLAGAYPNLDVVMLWGNMNATTKELFRDQLLVRDELALHPCCTVRFVIVQINNMFEWCCSRSGALQHV